eukprot:UN33384
MDLTGDLRTIRDKIFSNENGGGLRTEENIKKCIHHSSQQTLGDDQCPVCLEEKLNTMILPCQHKFHGDCIIQWVDKNFSCPVCRAEVSQFVPLQGCKSSTQKRFIEI